MIKIYGFILFVTGLSFALFFSCNRTPESDITVSEILPSKNARTLTDISFEATESRIARGEYLVNSVMWCFNCHTERDTTKPGHPPILERLGSGRSYTITDSTWFYTSNITSDPITGIGNHSDDMLARAIREGVGSDGRSLKAMPWYSFRALSDEDLASVITYLRTLNPVNKVIPKRNIGDQEESFLQYDGLELRKSMDPPDFENPLERGKYLIELANCIGCHTAWYERNPGAFGCGNPMEDESDIFSSNISSDPTGIGSWSEETFINVMRTGKNGTLDWIMPWTAYRNMTDEDLSAIYQALQTTKPVEHIVLNGAPISFCEVCGQEHGGGSLNKIPAPEYIDRTIPKDLAGAYVHELFHTDTVFIYYEDEKLMSISIDGEQELKPISDTHYSFDGLYAPIEFISNDQNVIALKYWDLSRSRYLKIK